MSSDSLWETWSGWPFVTKHLGLFSFAMTCAVSFKMINPYYLVLIFDRIFSSDFEVWRLITNAVFFGGFGMNFLFAFMLFIQYSSELETKTFSGRVADFIFCILFGLVPMTLLAYFSSSYVLSSSLMMYMVYIYCNYNPDNDMRLMFIPTKIPSRWFPFALTAFHVVLGGGIDTVIEDGIGILCGHLYYFLEEKYPEARETKILNTPSFLYWLFPPNTMGQVHGVHGNAPRAQQQQPEGRRPFPGQGRTLN